MAQPLGTKWWHCSVPMVVRGGTLPLPLRWHSHNPSGHVYEPPSGIAKLFSSCYSQTQHPCLLNHSKFWPPFLYFTQHWSKWSLQMVSGTSCVQAINVFTPIVPAGWTLPSGILHLPPYQLTCQWDQPTLLAPIPHPKLASVSTLINRLAPHPSIQYTGWLRSAPQAMFLLEKAEFDTPRHFHPWPLWVCLCQRPENARLCLSSQLGRSQVPFNHVP